MAQSNKFKTIKSLLYSHIKRKTRY